jgi:hypothetical protein
VTQQIGTLPHDRGQRVTAERFTEAGVEDTTCTTRPFSYQGTLASVAFAIASQPNGQVVVGGPIPGATVCAVWRSSQTGYQRRARYHLWYVRRRLTSIEPEPNFSRMQRASTHGTTATVTSGRCLCARCLTPSATARKSKAMLRNNALVIIAAALAASAMSQTATLQRAKIAIVGATLIDVSGYGRSTNDIADSVVLIEDGKITATGPALQVPVPSGTPRIDAHGKFLIPGLIDGFGALRTQAFANAYLYEGVTTVYVPTVLPNGGGDGELKIVRNPSPGPRLFLGAPLRQTDVRSPAA